MKVDQKIKDMPWPEPYNGGKQTFAITLSWPVVSGERLLVITFNRNRKADARKAFAKVEMPVEILINAVQKQKASAQWTKDGGQFIPNPSTWLNQGRWEDELPVAGNSGVPKGASGTLGEAELYSIRKALSDMEDDQ